MPAYTKLRDLIRSIRTCRTAQDERDLINKECASIRTSFKDEDNEGRARNVAKLLYIHMMGYPAHFGQMECLKLIASPRFSDKRVGYLGSMMLLDERQDLHLLITNSMKSDMNHQVQYVVGLSLCALGSICSESMSRDLSNEVEKLLKSSNPYIVRKAALCAVRLIQKAPDLMEMYIPTTRSLLNEKNHGVLIGGVCLVTAICQSNPDSLSHFRRFVPNLVRILKNLVMSGYTPEHDVHGISDPFLQVRILRLLRLLGKGDNDASEAMNDMLAQVATNTEPGKNVGHAVLYETVVTIMEIQSESGLRVLAINILGRFLSNSDRNVRYVALNTLLKTVHIDHSAVQRHRNTILDCLKENDVSIQKRALELSFALVNTNNIRSIMKEIVQFLDRADSEFKPNICANIIKVCNKYSPTPRWHIDTVLDMLVKAGGYIPEDLVPGIVAMISENEDLHALSVQRLYTALTENIAQQTLAQVGVWCVGEYGDMLINGQVEEEETIEITEDEVLDMIQRVMESTVSSQTTRDYAINAVMKLSIRFSSITRIMSIINKYSDHMDMELQQRSVEYGTIFTKYESKRTGIFERMPVLSIKKDNDIMVGGDSPVPNGNKEEPVKQVSLSAPPQETQQESLLDLLSSDTNPVLQQPVSMATEGNSLLDLLDSTPTLQTTAPPTNSSELGGLLDFLNEPAAPTGIPAIIAFDKDGLVIEFNFERDPMIPSNYTIILSASNSNPIPITEFVIQAAVPKNFELQLQSPTGNVLLPNTSGRVKQRISIITPKGQPLRMRLRINYSINGTPVLEQAEVNNFPSELI